MFSLNLSTNTLNRSGKILLPGIHAYGMAKGAIEVMSRYLAAELGARKIRVNTLAPVPLRLTLAVAIFAIIA